MGTLVGHGNVSKEAIKHMKESGGDWFAYQNEGAIKTVKLRFMKCGDNCFYNKPPDRLPETYLESGLPYHLVGKVDIVQEKVTAMAKEKHT